MVQKIEGIGQKSKLIFGQFLLFFAPLSINLVLSEKVKLCYWQMRCQMHNITGKAAIAGSGIAGLCTKLSLKMKLYIYIYIYIYKKQ